MLNIPAILNFAASSYLFLFNIIVYFKNSKSKVNAAFAFFGLTICLWLASFGMAYSCSDQSLKIALFRVGYIGIILIPINFHLFLNYLLGKPRPILLRVGYGLAAFFLFLNFSPFPLVDGVYVYSWGIYPKVSHLYHPIFLIYFNSLFSYAFFLLIKASFFDKHSSEIQRTKIRYILVGSCFGVFGSIDNLASYGLDFYPMGFLFMIVYPSILSYAILRYRLLDISIAITRTGIFVGTYSFVLGIPFAIAFGLKEYLLGVFKENWWMFPLVCSTVLATAGPFLYLYIQKKAEDRLFEEQHRYQTTLRQASGGMGRVKDLNRLVALIAHIVTRTVRLDYAAVYLFDKATSKFKLGAVKSYSARDAFVNGEISEDSALIQYLLGARAPVVRDEIKQRTEDFGDLSLARVELAMLELSAAVAVPSLIDDKMLAIIILGRKLSGRQYTEDDLNVFSILANQAALAIENAQFYEDMKHKNEQLFKAEKMATIGTMADGLSHQINNRLHALGFIASDVLDTLKLKKDAPMTPEIKEVMVDIEHALSRIQENVTQGGEIVRGLLKYSRKGEEGMGPVDLDQLISAAVEMTQFKIKPGELKILREYGQDIPKLKGNFTQLQEVFFNMIDNAYDAMMQRKSEFKEPGYEATIRVSAVANGNGHLDIFIEDNGIGVKDEDKKKLFTPFFTTKLSSKKGTGLGLYVIQKIIEENHGGKVSYESFYKKGTKAHLCLPVV
ncbi:MAG: ATP-binding protein [Candidatus Omnitrophota bacterium]|nr:ATP-binding protein [Candidatus Omnitrophota bacterium]